MKYPVIALSAVTCLMLVSCGGSGLRHYSVVSDEDLVKAHEQGLTNARHRKVTPSENFEKLDT